MAEQPNHLPPHYCYVSLFIFLISSTVISHKPACNKRDQESLWSSFDMPFSHLNWSSDDCCHWEGITCDMAGQVTHISLPYKGLKLKGGNTSLLGNLTHLIHLNLSHNSLHGSLDQTRFFSALNRSLEILDLSYNLLSGELPISVPSSSIRMLDLSSNQFYGSIPSLLFRQAWNLTNFNVSNNSFTGSIPSSNICFHSYPSIKRLDFSFNQFNGSISHGLGKCSKLEVFRAGHNNLSGLLPVDIYNATKLEELALPSNSLYGAISESISKLSKLKLVFLQFNNLEGSLPLSLMNCTNLVELRLMFNHLKGDISTFNFSKLSQLTKLDLGYNQLTGILPISL